MTGRIDETHYLVTEPGPYPPGEGPADYADCEHGCNDLTVACVATWPADDWVEVDQPAPDRWETTPADINDIDACTECERPIGFSEQEYEGQYGLRIVEVWVPPWTHPALPGVIACEDCTTINWGDDR